jgi:tetratricopeptide (TPR) repeat protein
VATSRAPADHRRKAAARVLAAAAAAALAVVAGLRAHADAAYRQGLGYTAFPAEDVPGRLEAYEEAVRRSPRRFVYRLRAGQIHLARARDDDDAHHREAASEHLRVAVAVHPMDARVHVALAQLAVLEGDPDRALDALRRGVATGPRHPAVQEAAVRIALEIWSQEGRVDALADALDHDALRVGWNDAAPRLRVIDATLRQRRDRAVGDLLEACAGRRGRLETAARWLARAIPEMSPVLDAALRRAREGS